MPNVCMVCGVCVCVISSAEQSPTMTEACSIFKSYRSSLSKRALWSWTSADSNKVLHFSAYCYTDGSSPSSDVGLWWMKKRRSGLISVREPHCIWSLLSQVRRNKWFERRFSVSLLFSKTCINLSFCFFLTSGFVLLCQGFCPRLFFTFFDPH